MKKYLIVLAAAVVALASCKPGSGESGSKYTKISFKESALELAVGETAKLKVLSEPTTLDAPVCEWASSNAEVVTVDQNGNIEALAEGEANITAKCGELSAVCKVSVKSIYDLLSWNLVLMIYDETDISTAIGDPYIVTSAKGVEYKVQKFAGSFVLCGEGIDYVKGTGPVGAGFTAFVDCPIEVITEGDYAGYAWTNEIIFSNASPADSAGVCPEGALTDAAEWYKYLTDTLYEGDGSFKGAPIHYIDWDAQKEIDYLGFIKNGFLGDYSDGVFYKMNVTWMEGAYGLAVDENNKLIEPAQFAPRHDQYYENLPESAVSKKPLVMLKKAEGLKRLNVRNLKDSKVFMHK